VSGGRYGDAAAIDAFLRGLQVEARRDQREEFVTRWQTYWILGCLLALLVVEWSLRKTHGMI
ncbi:MAG: hypothetical protein PHR35_21195, partial [Kiritimatiellae bacterium]|nr:hypothetical protein [Kiritimatiellia bacterium]